MVFVLLYGIFKGAREPIKKKILEKHDARYGVETSENTGSCFWFELKIIK